MQMSAVMNKEDCMVFLMSLLKATQSCDWRGPNLRHFWLELGVEIELRPWGPWVL